ncbi:MAG: hypothetical protein LPK80_05970 [Bacteroidota bacterium]|nr:hypothetical protein [Bacteroidota bacterium]MDX5448385.1 hypothetical protein [Bacteroidota bacterium]MDX5506249.1 hypothetical protein [Bacteroidota bacterium]
MDIFLEILKYTFPSLLMLLLAYIMLSNFIENEENRRRYFLKRETQKSALPARLQAYERLVLLLERITPSSLIVRLSSKGLTVKEYHSLILKAIRNEFEHNLSQQVYITDESWQMVVTAKSATVSIINNIAGKMNPDDPGFELGKKILEHAIELGHFPTKSAIHFLKEELHREI